MARPVGSQNKDKPFRDALRMEALLADQGEDTPAKPGSLRYIARQLLIRAAEETAAVKEIADRLDGKVPQGIVGDADEEPVNVLHRIERVIVSPPNQDG
jgi:hypothetical protein